MIDHDKRLIFVHIQKTGGNAICTALGERPSPPEKHFFARDLIEVYGQHNWNTYFKFAIVRNPWDRLVSWWSMIDANRSVLEKKQHWSNFQRFIVERARTFDEFLENCDVEINDKDGKKWIYRNQIDYLADTSGRLLVDYVGRFESLQQDFDFITKKTLGHSVPIPHVNRSQHRHYSKYYTPELVDKVAHRFQRDIKLFGYVFGQ